MKRIRAVAGLTLGLTSALFGLLMTLPSVWSRWSLSRPGVAISEWPWLPIGTGLAAIGLSRPSRRRIGGWFGLVGTALAMRPLWQLQATSRHHEQAMRDGLGDHYLEQIAPDTLRNSAHSRVALRESTALRRQMRTAVRCTSDVLYRVVDEHELHADLYQPPGIGPHPALISIHGGSWRAGDKGGMFTDHALWLAHQGYVVLDVQYRLSPRHTWPAHLEDIKTAIRWLRGQAEAYHVDPERIGLIGRSAGGHLALMAAFTPHDPAFPAPPGLPERDDVQAVVAVYPPTDLALLQSTVYSSLDYWLGFRIEERPDVYLQASPIFAAKKDLPPVLLAHGGFDNLVTCEHSERLHKRLRGLGGTSVYLHYPWARHGFDFSLSGLGGHMLQYDMDRFLAWTLRRGI